VPNCSIEVISVRIRKVLRPASSINVRGFPRSLSKCCVGTQIPRWTACLSSSPPNVVIQMSSYSSYPILTSTFYQISPSEGKYLNSALWSSAVGSCTTFLLPHFWCLHFLHFRTFSPTYPQKGKRVLPGNLTAVNVSVFPLTVASLTTAHFLLDSASKDYLSDNLSA
jgi:hypothetical protein